MVKEQILIIGKGGREHALGETLHHGSSGQRELFFAPGNPGTSAIGTNVDISVKDTEGLIRFAHDRQIGLTVVGPEDPLKDGIVDAFAENNLSAFGPTKDASRLEWDKNWAVEFMDRHHIPHPDSRIFSASPEALSYLDTINFTEKTGIVIKYPYLALGKGVVIARNLPDARQAVLNIAQGKFGRKSAVQIQELLSGPELSLMAFSDGQRVVPLIPAQDHKRLKDGDQGPNTGGMGAYAPALFVTPRMLQEIHETILQPTVDGMKKEGYPYTGLLYAGLMLTSNGPQVLEFNSRFGDPETQPVLSLLQSDLAPVLVSCIEGSLHSDQVRFRPGSAVCIVLAAAGYPETPEKGQVISGLGKLTDPDVQIFQAGTLLKNGQVVTHGGRVLGVTAGGKDLQTALKKAYSVIGNDGVWFEGMQYRNDIGKQALIHKLPT